jgi:ankyrin repeat protein
MSDEEFMNLCTSGTAQEVETAIKNGTDVNTRHDSGWTPLMWAASKNTDPEVISVLLQNGADINSKDDLLGMTALTLAARGNSNPEVISILLRNGADVNARGENGNTVCGISAFHNTNPEVISVLLENGADVNARDYRENTVLMWAVGFAPDLEEIFEEIAVMTDRPCEEVDNPDLETPRKIAALLDPLHEIVDKPNLEKIPDLPENGEDNIIRHDSGWTALMWAASENPNPEVVSILLQNGADINFKDDLLGLTALMLAARSNSNPEGISLLLRNGRSEERRVGKESHVPV